MNKETVFLDIVKLVSDKKSNKVKYSLTENIKTLSNNINGGKINSPIAGVSLPVVDSPKVKLGNNSLGILKVSETEDIYNVSIGEGSFGLISWGDSVFNISKEVEDISYYIIYSNGEKSLKTKAFTQASFTTPLYILAVLVVPPNAEGYSFDYDVVNNKMFIAYGANANAVYTMLTQGDLLSGNLTNLESGTLVGRLIIEGDLVVGSEDEAVELTPHGLDIYSVDFDDFYFGNEGTATKTLLANFNKDGVYFYDNSGNTLSSYRADGADIAGWSITSDKISSDNVELNSTGEYLSIGQTTKEYGTNVGIWLGIDTNPKLSLYKDANNFLLWDSDKLRIKTSNFELQTDGTIYATNVNLTGEIHASSGGTIGGFSIGANNITATNLEMRSGSTPYIYFGSDGTPAYEDVGVWLGIATDPKFSLVGASKYLKWDGTDLLINAGNFSVDASGNITSSGGTIGGWAIGSSTLKSTNNHIVLDNTNNRFEIQDSGGGTDIAIGYLGGIDGHNATEFGIWIGAADAVYIESVNDHDEVVAFSKGDWIVKDNANIIIGADYDNARINIGSVSGTYGMYLYNADGDILAEYTDSGANIYLGTSQSMKIGNSVGGSSEDGIFINTYNYWYDTGSFKVGNDTNYMEWTTSDLIVKGTAYLDDGVIGGLTTGWNIGSGNISSQNIVLHSDSANPYIGIGATTYEGTGIWFGEDSSAYKFSIVSSGYYFKFNGTDIEYQGKLTNITEGDISGWDLDDYYIVADTNKLWLSSGADTSSPFDEPFLSIGQYISATTDLGYDNKGIFLGMDGTDSKMSLVSDYFEYYDACNTTTIDRWVKDSNGYINSYRVSISSTPYDVFGSEDFDEVSSSWASNEITLTLTDSLDDFTLVSRVVFNLPATSQQGVLSVHLLSSTDTQLGSFSISNSTSDSITYSVNGASSEYDTTAKSSDIRQIQIERTISDKAYWVFKYQTNASTPSVIEQSSTMETTTETAVSKIKFKLQKYGTLAEGVVIPDVEDFCFIDLDINGTATTNTKKMLWDGSNLELYNADIKIGKNNGGIEFTDANIRIEDETDSTVDRVYFLATNSITDELEKFVSLTKTKSETYSQSHIRVNNNTCKTDLTSEVYLYSASSSTSTVTSAIFGNIWDNYQDSSNYDSQWQWYVKATGGNTTSSNDFGSIGFSGGGSSSELKYYFDNDYWAIYSALQISTSSTPSTAPNGSLSVDASGDLYFKKGGSWVKLN